VSEVAGLALLASTEFPSDPRVVCLNVLAEKSTNSDSTPPTSDFESGGEQDGGNPDGASASSTYTSTNTPTSAPSQPCLFTCAAAGIPDALHHGMGAAIVTGEIDGLSIVAGEDLLEADLPETPDGTVAPNLPLEAASGGATLVAIDDHQTTSYAVADPNATPESTFIKWAGFWQPWNWF